INFDTACIQDSGLLSTSKPLTPSWIAGAYGSALVAIVTAPARAYSEMLSGERFRLEALLVRGARTTSNPNLTRRTGYSSARQASISSAPGTTPDSQGGRNPKHTKRMSCSLNLGASLAKAGRRISRLAAWDAVATNPMLHTRSRTFGAGSLRHI